MIFTTVAPMSRQSIWSLVRNFRRILGVEECLYFNIINFVENVLSQIFPKFVFEICYQEEMEYLHGETIPSECKIRLREDVYRGACKDRGRDRLTLAHELGHFLMHDERSVVFCKPKIYGKIPQYYNSEWQANVFAGELLAPSYLITGMSANEIHEKCVVSTACARTQLSAIENEREKGFKINKI